MVSGVFDALCGALLVGSVWLYVEAKRTRRRIKMLLRANEEGEGKWRRKN